LNPGSGWITSVIILFVQLVVPILLLFFQVRESARFPAYNTGNVTSYDFIGLLNTDWDTFCYQTVAFDALVINVIIFIVYSIRVSFVLRASPRKELTSYKPLRFSR
jgi:hypothetical protein